MTGTARPAIGELDRRAGGGVAGRHRHRDRAGQQLGRRSRRRRRLGTVAASSSRVVDSAGARTALRRRRRRRPLRSAGTCHDPLLADEQARLVEADERGARRQRRRRRCRGAGVEVDIDIRARPAVRLPRPGCRPRWRGPARRTRRGRARCGRGPRVRVPARRRAGWPGRRPGRRPATRPRRPVRSPTCAHEGVAGHERDELGEVAARRSPGPGW